MRTYGGRLINSKVRREIEDRQELRDAMVWDVDTVNKYCRVKIQGTDKYIKAHYNENWSSTPEWLKPGNAVRISHPGGNKGRIEVVGHGILRPTAIPGGSMTPPTATQMDIVLTGMVLYSPSDQGMTAWVSVGTYRIDEVTYSFSGMTMDDATIEMDRPELFIDEAGGSVSFDAAHATLFRYDRVVVGTDGVLDVVKGSNSSGEPTFPAIPADHVLCGWVLIYPGMTNVTQADVNRTYSDPVFSELKIAYEDQDLDWGDDTTYFDVSARDQYGQIFPGYHTANIDVMLGTGKFSDAQGNYTCSVDGYVSLPFTFSETFRCYYERETTAPDGEWSPTFYIRETYTNNMVIGGIQLRNISGGEMGMIYV